MLNRIHIRMLVMGMLKGVDFIRRVVLLLLLSLLFNVAFAQTDTDFWFSVPEINRYHNGGDDNNPKNNGSPVFFRITAGAIASTVTVAMPANHAFNEGRDSTFIVPAFTTVTLDLNKAKFIGDKWNGDPGVSDAASMENRLLWTSSNLATAKPFVNKNNKGVHITATAPITVYYEISAPYNMDLLTLKGRNALGKEFFIPFQNSYNTALNRYYFKYRPYSSFDIVATEDNTRIRITPTSDVFVFPMGVLKKNVPFEMWLGKGETAILAPYDPDPNNISIYKTNNYKENRLIGSRVEVVEGGDIAIITRDDMVEAPTRNVDFAGDQLVPTRLIGKDYAVVRGQLSSDDEYAYIIATQNSTTVSVNGGAPLPVLNAGGFSAIQIPSKDPITTIKADKPIYVYHLSGFGDGAQTQFAGALVPTITTCTGSTRVAFNRTKDSPYNFYLNLLVRDGAESSFVLTDKNGKDATGLLPKLNVSAGYTSVGGVLPYSSWRYIRLDAKDLVANEAYMLSNTKDIFHVGLLNGSPGADAFYGYFSDFNELKIGANVTGVDAAQIKICFGSPIQVYASGGTKYEWSPAAYFDKVNVYNPILNKDLVGNLKVEVKVSGACGMAETKSIDVEIFPYTTADFSVDNVSGCSPLTVNFKNTSLNAANLHWKFGDGKDTISNKFSPPGLVDQFSHVYKNTTDAPITYTVQLIVKNASACAYIVEKKITVYPSVEAKINRIDPTPSYCSPRSVKFENVSPVSALPPADISFIWDYGDGGSANTSAATVTHDFSVQNAVKKRYDVSLTMINKFGCKSIATDTIDVYGKVKAFLSIDKNSGCPNPDFKAVLTDGSVGMIAKRNWSWDGFASVTHPKIANAFDISTSNRTPDAAYEDVRTIKLDVVGAGGCVDSYQQKVTIHPYVNALFSLRSDKLCDGEALTISNTSSVASTDLLWSFGDGSTARGPSPSHTYTNNSNSSVLHTVTLTAKSASGCQSTYVSPVKVTVYSHIDPNFVITGSGGCAPFNATIVNTSRGNATNTFEWTFGDGSNLLTENLFIANRHHLFSNTSTSPKDYFVDLKVINEGGCFGTISRIARSYPQPVADFNVDNAIGCNPLPVNLKATTNESNYDYSWSFDDGGTASQPSIAHTYSNFDYTNALTFNPTLTVSSIYGCSATISKPIVVHPLLKSTFTIQQPSVCTPFDVQITPNSLGATSYTWNFGDGRTETKPTSTPFTITYDNTTAATNTYSIGMVATNAGGLCQSKAKSVSVVVNPRVVAEGSFTFDDKCTGAVTFTNTSTGSTLYSWNFGDGQSVNVTTAAQQKHTYENRTAFTKSYTATLTAENEKGCRSTKIFTIDVIPRIEASFTVKPLSLCTPFDVQITPNSRSATSYIWNFGDGRIETKLTADPFTITYDNISATTNTYNIGLVATNDGGACQAMVKTVPVDVDPRVVADGSFTFDDKCTGAVNFINSSTGSGVYTWDFGDGQSANVTTTASQKHTYENRTALTKSYMATLTAVNAKGCKSTKTFTIDVAPRVESAFTYDVVDKCTPMKIKMVNSSLNGTEFQWDYGHTIGGVRPLEEKTDRLPFDKIIDSENINQVQTYILKLTTVDKASGCSSAYTKELTVYPKIISAYTSNVLDKCNGQISFQNNTTGATNYTWSFGDQSSSYSTDKLDPISHVFLNRSANSTNFNVKLVASNAIGCTAEVAQNMAIVPRVESAFTYDVVEKCTPMKINMVNSSFNGSEFQWDYGHTINGVAQQEIRSSKSSFDRIIESENLNSVQTYTLKLTSVDKVTGCSAVSTKDLTIYPKIIPAFTNAIVDKCRGLVSFQNTTTGAANYTWFFGDQSSSYSTDKLDAISHLFLNRNSNSTTFNAKLVASNAIGCSSEMAQDIAIVPRVESSFTLEELDICTPVKVKLTNSSLNGQQFTWDYGHTIGGVPQMEVKTDKLAFEKILDSESANSVQTYPIKLTVLDKNTLCADDSTIMLAVHPRLLPSFTSDKMTGCSNLPVILTNTSTGGTMLFGWNFNDGQSVKTNAVSESVAHTFVNRTSVTKSYNVMLTATNTKGCKSTASKTIGVYPKVEAAFAFVQPSKCTPFPIDITNSSLNGTEYSWDFGHTKGGVKRDTVTTTKAGFRTYIYNDNGENTQKYTIGLTARDAITGCSDLLTIAIDAKPEVKSLFNLSTDRGCNPLAVSFSNNTAGSTSYSWNFGNGTSSSSFSPAAMSYVNTDTVKVKTYVVTLTAKNADGCTNMTTKRVDVYPKIMADFNLDKARGCTPFPVKVFNSYTSSAYRYEWSLSSNGTNSDQQIPELNLINSTTDYSVHTESVKLKVFYKGDATCFKEVERKVEVYPSTRSDFSMDVSEACNPLPINFTNKTKSFSSATSYRWSFDNLGSSSEMNPKYTFSNLSRTLSSTYTVKLKSTSVHGCNDSISRTVVVRPIPKAQLAINVASGCAPFNVEVQNLSVGATPQYTFWMDGDRANSIVKNGNMAVHFNINNLGDVPKTTEMWLKAVSDFGCKDSVSQKTFTYPHVTSSFSFLPSNAGCNPLTVDFFNTSKNAKFYTWDFDDGATADIASPNHVFRNFQDVDRTFNVKLKVMSEQGCEHTSSKDFTVYSSPIAYFTIDPPIRTYPDAAFIFNNKTSPKVDRWNYEWTYGDGGKYVGVNPPVYTYKTWGDVMDDYKYYVTLKVSNGKCQDEMKQFLYLKPAIPISNFETNIGSGCSPLEAQFSHQAKYYKSIEWDFGDGTKSTADSPYHVYKIPGRYHTQLTVIGDGGATYSYKTLEVFPSPIANFKLAPAEAMLPDAKVNFYNTSQEGVKYSWLFGDALGTSAEKNPVYTYEKLGEYDVMLQVTSENGCVDDTLVKAAVKVVGEGLMKFPNAFIPNLFGGNGGTFEMPDYKNEVFHPISKGVVVYRLLVYNRWGEKLFDSEDVNIGWDGYSKGKLCEQGVYVYRATGRFTNGKSFDVRGDVTLLR